MASFFLYRLPNEAHKTTASLYITHQRKFLIIVIKHIIVGIIKNKHLVFFKVGFIKVGRIIRYIN